MPDERLSPLSSAAHIVADPSWSEHYDMSPLRRETAPSYRQLPNLNSDIAITPLPPTGAAHRVAMLEVWAHQAPAPCPTAITRYQPSTAAQAEFSRGAHLKVMGELTVSIAHEICQPLLAIAANASACLRWLQRETPNVDEAIGGLKDIRAECERAASIVTALRALAKQSPAKNQSLNIDEVIREVIHLSAPARLTHKVTLQTSLLADQVVIGDRVQIQQLVLNLITNAVEAMGGCGSSGRTLRVSSQALREGVQVTIDDNGPGIPRQERQQIFDAFYTTKNSGLGMGLTICRSVIEAHKGSLYAEDSEMGGARIRFQLPFGCRNH